MKYNVWSLYTLASVSTAILESIQKKKCKKSLGKFIGAAKKIDFKGIKNSYFMSIFENIA
jgi:hypothetical protein